MSADSLNGSPRKFGVVDDRTFTKDPDADADACERLSQVSPFVLSPTTDTSAPENSDVTGVSTLSKTTVPTDAKISKPSETQCLSKATSIDSWCSNDTLYNVEEAFDDLVSDPDLPQDFELDKELDNSESSHTLTINDEKELSHVSTYIVHDSHSDEDRFSPDSITANDNDNHTYTKVKNAFETSPSALTKSEVNDSKTQTKDLAYGTLMSGAPSYSNCTTEVLSADNTWMFPQPELVRRSPIDATVNMSAPADTAHCEIQPDHSPQLKDEPRIKKMDSVEISCLEDHLHVSNPENNGSVQTGIYDSPNYHYDMGVGVTSTPLAEPTSDENAAQPLPIALSEEKRTPENLPNSIPNFQSFFYSAELRPQNWSYNPTEGSQSVLLERDRTQVSSSPSYREFEIAANFKPQDTSRIQSSQNDSEEFRRFENSVRDRPQDLSTIATALLLSKEHSADNDHAAPETRDEPTPLIISPPSKTNLEESHVPKVNTIIITDLEEDETEQPHSIIIAEVSKESPNRTFDSHIIGELNHTYDSHSSRRQNNNEIKENVSDNSKEITANGIDEQSQNAPNFDFKSPEVKAAEEPKQEEQSTLKDTDTLRDVPNGSVPNLFHVNNAFEIKCNGNSEKFATVNFISDAFEELLESNVDDSDCKDKTNEDITELSKEDKVIPANESVDTPAVDLEVSRKDVNGVEDELVAVTEDFLQNEKNFCQFDAYLPLLSDIRFTGKYRILDYIDIR